MAGYPYHVPMGHHRVDFRGLLFIAVFKMPFIEHTLNITEYKFRQTQRFGADENFRVNLRPLDRDVHPVDNLVRRLDFLVHSYGLVSPQL